MRGELAMSAELENPSGAESTPKKPYTTPQLIEYGRATDLTGGGATGSPEASSKGNMKFA